MKRHLLNCACDTISAILLPLLASTGFILHVVLTPGSPQQGLVWMGLGRHAWGEVHFILALVFLGSLFGHLFLHWRWIWSVATAGRAWRRSVFAASLLALLVLMVLPFFIEANQDLNQSHGGRHAWARNRD